MTELLHNLMLSMDMLLQWDVFAAAAAGVLFGLLMGSVPGLSDIIAICLLVPFTFFLSPVAGIAMLMGLSKGANFGGAVPAVLFNIPGTPQALITSFDGYPLNKQGKGGKALKVALFSSVIADSLSDCVLFFFAAPVAAAAIMIGPMENVSVIVFALTIIAMTTHAGPVPGLISLFLGLFLSSIGMDPLTGAPRFSFGSDHLSAGIEVVPLCLGFFVIAEIIWQMCGDKMSGAGKKIVDVKQEDEDHSLSWKEFKSCLPAIARGTGIGTAIGALPGIGTTVGSYLSYISSQKLSKNPEKFGKGAIEGIAASEAGNNAVNGPNLIPLITLGIPGNIAAALLLGAFTMQGLTPGPMFMETQAPMLYALFSILFISNVFLMVFGYSCIGFMRRIVSLPKAYIYSAVIVCALIGTYVVRNDPFDLVYTLIFSLIGLLCRVGGIPVLPLLIAYILGSSLELKIRQTLDLYAGDVTVFFQQPVAQIFFCLSGIVVLIALYKSRQKSQAPDFGDME